MFESVLDWAAENRMPLLVGLTLLWTALVRVGMGAVVGARMALFGAAPVVLVTWLWMFDLALLDFSTPQVVAWWIVLVGFVLGSAMDVLDLGPGNGGVLSLVFATVALLLLGASLRGGLALTSPGQVVAAWQGEWVIFALTMGVLGGVIWCNAQRAGGATVARLVSHFLFALGGAYLMRAQGFSDTAVLATSLMAVHLVVPIVLVGLDDLGRLGNQVRREAVRRPSYPGWSGLLGLIVPLYLGVWLNVSIEPVVAPGTLGLRSLTLLTLLLLADWVIMPVWQKHNRRRAVPRVRFAVGTRTFYLTTALGLVLAAIWVQRTQALQALA